MASSTFPALAVNTQGESPLNMLAKVEQIKSAQQSQQMADIQIQNARLQQQSNATIMAAIAKHQGNLDEALADTQTSGKVLPADWLNLREKSVALQTAMYKNTEAQNAVIKEQNEMITNVIDSVKALPVEQRAAAILNGVADLGKRGVDVSNAVPMIRQVIQNPTDQAVKEFETAHMGAIWAANKASADYAEAVRPTVAQAQSKTAAELATAQTNAIKAQRDLDNMPTAAEAHTQRAATLLETRAQAQKALADAAKTRAETVLAQQEPVEGTNAAGQRQVLPRAAAAKVLTQLTPLSADQFNKEAMLSSRFGQVAQNLGKYESAIRDAGPVTHSDDVAQVIADQALGSNPGHLLGLTPAAPLYESKEVSKVTADAWNRMTPDERRLAAAYLQVKGGIITYNKAVDDTGRANETALALEAANIPSPLEQKSVALQRLQGNKDNIRSILPAIPQFDHLVNPLEYLKEGEKTPLRQVTGAPSAPVINFAP